MGKPIKVQYPLQLFPKFVVEPNHISVVDTFAVTTNLIWLSVSYVKFKQHRDLATGPKHQLGTVIL